MEIIKAIILGIVQGLTEFLPVSSSGHLELSKYFIGDHHAESDSLFMTVLLHFGTALATVYVFRKHILQIIRSIFTKNGEEERNFALKIIISMIPAAIVGVLFEKQIEHLFSQNILLVCLMLMLTGVLLFLADKSKVNNKNVSYLDAIIIGVAQAIAIIPGISRSGATISTSVLLGIDKAKAAEFSFLMVVPLIFGKIAKDLLEGEFGTVKFDALTLSAGFLAAFVTGVLACTWMIKIVRNSTLKYFAYYCLAIGLAGIIYVTLAK